MPTQNLDINSLPIALTMGDPAGISTEITILAWKQRTSSGISPFFVLSRQSLFDQLMQLEGFRIPTVIISSPDEANEAFDHALPILELPDAVDILPGQPDPTAGAMTIQSISTAVDLVRNGRASCVVTNPINKHVLYQAGFTFPGHTEYLAELAKQWGNEDIRPVMMLVSKQMRTVPLTIHIALADVEKLISKELISETARIISSDMKKYFGLQSPRISVAGLNPHAGESGAMGKTEIDIIEPTIEALKREGLNISGPFPADTLFHAAARKTYDVVIGMYHDQALIPIKTLGFDEGVNTTLGLPFVRTSPDHGTAYDIAGKGLANPQSLIEALKLAKKMSDQSLGQS
jgi:4-hydroxythreonine-4-phosphate dehydrogenase